MDGMINFMKILVYVYNDLQYLTACIGLLFHCVHLNIPRPADARAWAWVAWVLAMPLRWRESGDVACQPKELLPVSIVSQLQINDKMQFGLITRVVIRLLFIAPQCG